MVTTSTTRLGANVTNGAKKPCVVATTANITLSGTQTIDAVAVAVNDRVLVKDQTDGTENGIYLVASGSWTRVKDWNTSADLASGVLLPVGAGTAGTGVWQVTYTGAFALNTTDPTFTLLA
jgi:phage-related tail fiber protein